jgi:hypothetical protein
MPNDARVAVLTEMRESVERLNLLVANIHPSDVDEPAKQEVLAQVSSRWSRSGQGSRRSRASFGKRDVYRIDI